MIVLYFLMIAFFLLLCAVTCFIVLMQESKSTGLGASFGGEATESVFGTSAADVIKRATAWLGGIFLLSCLLLSIWTNLLARPPLPNIETPIIERTESV